MIWRWDTVSNLLKDRKPLRGAEIGVKEGRFISHLLKSYPELTMYAVDPWEEQPEGNETYEGWHFTAIYDQYKSLINLNRDRVIELRQYSEEAAQNVEDASLDFVFIDAQHDYDSVKRDIELWKPKVKPGGLFCGHDYEPNFPGVIKAVDERFPKVEIGGNAVWSVAL